MNKDKMIEEKTQLLEELLSDREYKPMKFKELSILLQVPKDEREILKTGLNSLITEGKIIINHRGQYELPGEDVKVGVFAGTQKGFGFLVVEGEEEDVFIPEDATMGAFHGDTVMVKVNEIQTGKRKEGMIISILNRARTKVVGTFQRSKNFGFVVADNHKLGKDFFIPKEKTMGAKTGDKVVIAITNYGRGDKNPEAKVIEVLGGAGEPGVDIMSVIREYELPLKFNEDVMKQLKSVPDVVSPKEISGRKDIRELLTVTIDGEDAKDLDDAITISKKGDNYTLGVHIADVTHYIAEGSALDQEAYKRGTSIYLINQVIPMLPPKLSNGICSLNAGSDRLALSCFMEIDKKGNIVGHSIDENVINVDHRMSYTRVAEIIEGIDIDTEDKDLVSMLYLMEELAGVLREKRKVRGSINFDFPESMITLDNQGVPIDVSVFERNKATKIIEEFMLITNETIGEDYFWQELPFLYRTHDTPDSDKIRILGIFINNFGYSLKTSQEEIHPKEIQKLLTKIEDTPEEALISRLALRSMKQAKYTVINTGHFGLSAKYYSHFTAPIRRYPDLQIHRIIKENIRGKLSGKNINHYHKILPEVANHSSKTERRAEEIEREVDKLKKVQYMSKFIGDTFEGVLSGITSWGMYVELPNTIEGMIHVNNMEGDYYFYDEERYQMVGEHTKKTYKLGEKIKVKVLNADIHLKTIDFIIVED